MNCQEVRNLVERVLDRNLSGGVKRRFDLHLSRCEECRAFIAAEQAEHQRWFKAVNSSEELLHSLPTDFADRLVAAVVARSAMRRPFFMRLPRWALLAASLALMAGFVFASVKLTMENVEFEEGEGDGTKAVEGTEATAVEISDTAAIDPSASYVASVSPSPSTQLETNQEGITPMSKTKAAGAALSAALAAAPLAAANGDGYQFIISGDPVAAAAAGSSSASSATAALAVGSLSDGFVYDSEFEARSRTTDDSNASSLRSDPCTGMILTFR